MLSLSWVAFAGEIESAYIYIYIYLYIIPYSSFCAHFL